MKNRLPFARLSFLFFMMILTSLLSLGQNNDNGTKLKFVSQSDGKIAYLNTTNQKVFNFVIEGITNQQQIDDFLNKFQGKKFVVSVNVTNMPESNNQCKGQLVLDRIAKIPDFRELLVNAGFSNIYVDEEFISVDELELLKSSTPVKPHK